MLLPLCTGQLWSGVENICLALKVSISADRLPCGLRQTWAWALSACVLLVQVVLLVSRFETER